VTRYDLCVIGAGPAGIAGAVRASDLGKRVVLIDAGPLGGAGIFDGALSSKTLWHLSGDYARAHRGDRGYDGGRLAVSWQALRTEVAAACREAQVHVERELASLVEPRAGRGTVERVVGRASFASPQTIAVAGRQIEADKFLLAVGSRPRVPPNVAVDGVRVITSDHVEHVGELPKRLAIVGAGVVGCEYATIFAQLGQTHVELFDRQARILPFEDEDVSAVVAERFTELGVEVQRCAKIERIVKIGDEVEIAWTDEHGAPVTRRYDRVLVATGRGPSTDGLALDKAGVAVGAGGGVTVDDGTRTSAPHVWAAGDVTPDIMLANLAELEARQAVEDMFGLDPAPLVHEAQASIYFLSPEVAGVGLNETMAKAKGIDYRAAYVSNKLNRRNIAMRATTGFVKLLARRDGRLLGLRVVGPQAGTAVQGVALLIGQGDTIEAVERCVHPHPSVTEGVLEAARVLLGCSIYKPEAMPDLIRVTESPSGEATR
jgi:dihydrolipoamide dehydrogenase